VLPAGLEFDCKQAPTPWVETKRTRSRVCNVPGGFPNCLAASSWTVPASHHRHPRRSQGLATTWAAAGWAERAGLVLAPVGAWAEHVPQDHHGKYQAGPEVVVAGLGTSWREAPMVLTHR